MQTNTKSQPPPHATPPQTANPPRAGMVAMKGSLLIPGRPDEDQDVWMTPGLARWVASDN